MTRQTTSATVIAVMVLAIAGAGCGGNDQRPDANSEQPRTEQPEEPTEEPGNSRQVSREDYGDAWPLTVESGTLTCEPPGIVTFTDSDGTLWGVNGLAISNDYPRIDPIWADDTDGPGPKIDMGPLIDDGLALCE